MKAYDGKLFDVVVENGKEIVRHPGSVAVVATDENGLVTLVRQTREPAGKRLIELPAGTLEEDEEPLASAKRELEEETGLHGGEWRELGTFWTTPGFCSERMHLFLATGCERGEPSPDEDEDVELVHWSREDVERRLDELEDAKTIAGLLLFLRETR
jgi:ADP-ribose pyrophosphatase